MNKFFNPDNAMNKMLSRLWDLIVLNVIFMVTCIPIITIGAALTSLTGETMRLVRHDEGNSIKSYFYTFKTTFKRSTLLWLPLMFLLIFFSADLYVIYKVIPMTYRFLQFPVWLLMFALISIAIYAFPLTALYEETYMQTITNSLKLSVGNLFYTIFFVLMLAIPVDIMIHNGAIAVVIFSFLLFFGFAGLSFLYCVFLDHMLEKVGS